MTATQSPVTTAETDRAGIIVPQHSLPLSIVLHLLPGAALTLFVVLAGPTLAAHGIPVVFALFAGIGLVIVPIELGYLLIHAKRTTGSFSLASTVTYRERVPGRKLVGWAAGLFAWFMVFFLIATAFLDAWIAERFFGWLPESIGQFAMVQEAGDDASGLLLIALLVIAVVFNGVVGPVVEELYFRGHLLPRIDRLGRWAPVLNTVLFSLYHFWTPWQNLTRIVGFLPISWLVWRERSVQVGIAAHVTINLVFLLLMLAMVLAGA